MGMMKNTLPEGPEDVPRPVDPEAPIVVSVRDQERSVLNLKGLVRVVKWRSESLPVPSRQSSEDITIPFSGVTSIKRLRVVSVIRVLPFLILLALWAKRNFPLSS